MKEVFYPRSGKSFREREESDEWADITTTTTTIATRVGGGGERIGATRWKDSEGGNDGKDEVGARKWTEGG